MRAVRLAAGASCSCSRLPPALASCTSAVCGGCRGPCACGTFQHGWGTQLLWEQREWRRRVVLYRGWIVRRHCCLPHYRHLLLYAAATRAPPRTAAGPQVHSQLLLRLRDAQGRALVQHGDGGGGDPHRRQHHQGTRLPGCRLHFLSHAGMPFGGAARLGWGSSNPNRQLRLLELA